MICNKKNKPIDLVEFNKIPKEGFEVKDGNNIIPMFKKPNESYLIFGKSGSGKSYFSSQLLKGFNKLCPESLIYFITNIQELEKDPSYKGINNIQIVSFDNLAKLFVSLPQLTNCCFVFDDADTFVEPGVNRLVWKLKKQILTTGRHYNQCCVICTHTLGGVENSTILKEIQNLVLFLNSRINKNTFKMICNYGALNPEDLTSYMKMDKKSRWLLINLDSNGYAMTQHKINNI